MTRHSSLVCVLFFLTLSITLIVNAAEESPKRPNIVFLMSDDHRWDALGCMGNKIIQTPNLDELAKNGVIFDNAFATTAICQTSRANVLFGQHARLSGHRHGNVGSGLSKQEFAKTYPAILKKAGYFTGYVGKWHMGKVPEGVFDYDKTYQGQGKYRHKVNGKPIHLTRHIGNQAVEMIDAAPTDKPFCLAVGFKSPHVQDGSKEPFYIYDEAYEDLYKDVTIPQPKLADAKFFESQPDFIKKSLNRTRWGWRLGKPDVYQRSVKGYYRLVTGIDEVVGRVVKKLEDKGVADNTIIIYTSDHGVYLGERGLAGKWLAHDVSMRIPCIVYDPRLSKEQRGVRHNEMVLTIDMAPTMLDFAGVTPPSTMQGESFRPLTVSYDGKPWRTEFFYDHYFIPNRIPPSEAVRTTDWKYIRYVNSYPLFEELYDLANDPQETVNLATSKAHKKQLESMRSKWNTLRVEAGSRDLFKGQTLAHWEVTDFGGQGEPHFNKDGNLVIPVGETLTGVNLKVDDIPHVNYEVTLQGRRVEGGDFWCGLTVPVKDSHASLILGGWGGTVCGISSVDGFDASENDTATFNLFKQNQWYDVRLRVTDEYFGVWLDGKQIVDLDTKNRKLGLRFETEICTPLGLCTWQTGAEIRNLRIRKLETKDK